MSTFSAIIHERGLVVNSFLAFKKNIFSLSAKKLTISPQIDIITAEVIIMNRLKQLRTARKLSLRNLSEQTGLEFSTIGYYERGERNFSAKSQQILSDFFGVSIDYLLGKSPEEMFNDFVDSLKRDFSVDTLHSDGEVTQSLDDSVREPVRTKIKILLMLREINDVDRLNTIYQTAKLQSAAEDFSTPAEED